MWVYFAIFFAKLVEVSLSTLRYVLVNRGERVKGAVIGFFEMLIWLVVISNVLSTVTEDPIKVLVYCLAFSCGTFLGITLENKLAIGTASIQAVVDEDKKDDLSRLLRERGFGVTIVQGEGMEGHRVDILMIFLKRKCVPEAIAAIRQVCPSTLVTVNDVRHLRNGFIRK
ncbi:MAG: DUF2179 domain-containing protein [Oscillospiraceae bacterium]